MDQDTKEGRLKTVVEEQFQDIGSTQFGNGSTKSQGMPKRERHIDILVWHKKWVDLVPNLANYVRTGRLNPG